jgi:hypothetical protein
VPLVPVVCVPDCVPLVPVVCVPVVVDCDAAIAGIRIDNPHTATQLVLFMMLLSFVDGADAHA